MWPIKNQSRIFPWVTFIQMNHSWYRYLKNLQEGIFGKSNVLIQWRTLSGNWKRIHAWYLIVLRVRWLNWPSIARNPILHLFWARRSGSGVETRGRSPQVSQGMPRHWRNGWVNVLICFCLSGTLWWVHPEKKASSNLFCLFIFRCGFHLLKQVCKSSTMNRKREIRFFDCGWMDRTMSLSITFQKSANIAILSKGASHHLQCHLVGSQGSTLSHFKRFEKLMDPKQMLLQTQTWWSYSHIHHTFLRPPKLQNEFAHTYNFFFKAKTNVLWVGCLFWCSKVWVASTLGWF